MARYIPLILISLVLASCSTIEPENGASQWDFDHNVQFRQTDIDENNYHIVVIPDVKTRFSKLATFLLRRSMDICQSYGFKIEVLSGVEDFDAKFASPNLIMSSLSANLECPK